MERTTSELTQELIANPKRLPLLAEGVMLRRLDDPGAAMRLCSWNLTILRLSTATYFRLQSSRSDSPSLDIKASKTGWPMVQQVLATILAYFGEVAVVTVKADEPDDDVQVRVLEVNSKIKTTHTFKQNCLNDEEDVLMPVRIMCASLGYDVETCAVCSLS